VSRRQKQLRFQSRQTDQSVERRYGLSDLLLVFVTEIARTVKRPGQQAIANSRRKATKKTIVLGRRPKTTL